MTTDRIPTECAATRRVAHRFENCGTLPCGRDAELEIDDVIFVNAVQYGRTILDASLTGLSDFSDLMVALRTLLADTAGLVTVNLRNRNRGWAMKQAMRVNRPASMLSALAGVA